MRLPFLSPGFSRVFFVNFFSLAFASLKTPASVRGFGYPPAPEDLISSLILHESGQVDRRYLGNQWGCQCWGAIKPQAPTTVSGWSISNWKKKIKKAIQTQAGSAVPRIAIPLLLETSVYRVYSLSFCPLYTGIYPVIARGMLY